MSLVAALLVASAMARHAPGETKRHLERELAADVAKVAAFHSFGDCVVRTAAAGEKPRALLDVVASGAGATAEQKFLDLVQLALADEGGVRTVRSLFPPPDQKPASLSFAATLTLVLPDACALVLDTSYGKALVDGRGGDVKVTNKFGAVEVSRVRGNVEVGDSFNTVTVRDVSGDLTVLAKHCPVVAETIGGLAKIRTNACAVAVRGAGAADVETTNVSVELRAIAHDARIVAPFCSVSATGVGGNLAITSGNFPVHVADVDGNLSVDQSGGSLTVDRVKGKATVTGSRCDTTLRDVGSADLHCPWSALHLTRVGSFVAENTSRTLAIVDPLGDVSATSTGGLIDFSATKLPAGDAAREITLVANGGGKIELALPADGSYVLDATSTVGTLECTLPGMDVTQQGTARVGTLRRGDGRTKLHATCVGGAIRVVPAVVK
jgi:hypothetical protein